MRARLCLTLGALLALTSQAPAQTGTPAPVPAAKKKDATFRVDRVSGPTANLATKAKLTPLEESFLQALRNNPDIRVAEAKVREAEEELNRTRMKVLNRLVSLQQELRSLQADVDKAEVQYQQTRELASQREVPLTDVQQAQAGILKAKAERARAEAERDYLVGKQLPPRAAAAEPAPGSGPWQLRVYNLEHWMPADLLQARSYLLDATTGKRIAPLPVAIQSSQADKLRKALDTPVQLPGAEPVSPKELIDLVRAKAKGLNVYPVRAVNLNEPLQVVLTEPVPVGALFQLLEDQLGWTFIVRDYGIVAVERQNVPPGAMLLQDFWKSSRAAQTTEKQTTEKK